MSVGLVICVMSIAARSRVDANVCAVLCCGRHVSPVGIDFMRRLLVKNADLRYDRHDLTPTHLMVLLLGVVFVSIGVCTGKTTARFFFLCSMEYIELGLFQLILMEYMIWNV